MATISQPSEPLAVGRRCLAVYLATESQLTPEELADDIGEVPDDYYSDYLGMCAELKIKPIPLAYWRDLCVS